MSAATHPLRGRLRFPATVDEVSARLVAGGVVVLAAITVLLQVRWLVLVLAYGFVARAIAGPTLSPLGLLVTRVVRPRLPLAPRPVPGPPKQFAQALGAVFTVSAAIATYGFDEFGVARVLLALLVLPASAEALLGWCLGCRIFALLMRAGIVPERVCLQCADLWGRDRARPTVS